MLTTYRIFIEQKNPILAGVTTPLNIKIVDQFGRQFTDFDMGRYGKYLYYATVAIAPRDLTSLAAAPLTISPYSAAETSLGGGMLMDTAIGSVPKVPFQDRVHQPEIKFPKEGQYVMFVEFWPHGSDKVILTTSIEVGKTQTPAATLTPNNFLTQNIGELRFNLKATEPIMAGEYVYLSFDAVDAKGQLRSDQIQMLSGDLCSLYIVDENLEVFLKPDFINRDKLLFSVKFPKPGKYKAWLEFNYAGKVSQLAYVVDVK
jgi:hypothetical protein